MDEIIKKFKVENSKKFDLKLYDPTFTADFKKDDAINLLNEYKMAMDNLQEKLYADDRYSLLIIFQAMDGAGKDSAIKHVMSGINPQGCQVFSFKQPNSEEYDHDFLWRHYKALPEKGRIGIHNRSHYENVLICKVHPELILKERNPAILSLKDVDEKFWTKRYESIIDFEKHLARNGVIIIKFFLHVSKEEQKMRFIERIEDPKKNWKFSSLDVDERQYWDKYMKTYEEAITATTTEDSPWYIVPADKKWFTRIAISKIIIDTLQSIDLKYPKNSAEEQATLEDSKRSLSEDK